LAFWSDGCPPLGDVPLLRAESPAVEPGIDGWAGRPFAEVPIEPPIVEGDVTFFPGSVAGLAAGAH
jgi:hypothetical protein